jgi:hypothetical protein
MDKTLILGIVSSVVAISAAVISVWGQLRVKRVEAQLELQRAEAGRRAETEQTARRFREPLGRAAYELQSRIFNIITRGFLTTYLQDGDGRTRSYAINHTLFVITQYFAWTELIRVRFNSSIWAPIRKRAALLSSNTRFIHAGKPTNTAIQFFACLGANNTQSANE